VIPDWLWQHRANRGYWDYSAVEFSRLAPSESVDPLVHVAETAFNSHEKNTGEHVSPFDTGVVRVGVDGLEVRLLQGVDMEQLKQVVSRGTRATIGLPRPPAMRHNSWPEPTNQWGPYASPQMPVSDEEWQEMFKGGLQAALESAVVVFEVWGASRVLTHQLVRSRRAGFHQQSQRSTWYGDRPEARMPETIWRAPEEVRIAWSAAYLEAWNAYRAACDAGVPYEDARYILPEGTVNYIQCEYTVREFMAVYAYRGCSMFLREMVECMRAMRTALVAQCPELEPFIKISCEKSGKPCTACDGTGKVQAGPFPKTPDMPWWDCEACAGTGGRKCTFQGWENVELACNFPWAKENNRVFVASPKLRIGAS
jgi:flavin-dependent thymidylate synthase